MDNWSPAVAVRAWMELMERAWNPDAHPRGPDGRFIRKGGGSAASGKAKSARPTRSKAGGGQPATKSKTAPTSDGGKTKQDGTSGGDTPKRQTRSKPAAKSDAKPAGKKTPAAKTGTKPVATPPAKDKAFLDSHYGEWKNNLSPAQEKAMRFYQSPGFALMNGQLRGLDKKDIKADVSFDDADLARAAKASKDLKSAIRKAPPLQEPMTVYRGFSADQFGDLEPGMQIQDKGFVSTSITNDVGSVGRATRQATAEIVLPRGTKAAAGSSREMVLPPGSKFRVQSVTTRKGVPHVVMELVV
jgi:hypothetical protein